MAVIMGSPRNIRKAASPQEREVVLLMRVCGQSG